MKSKVIIVSKRTSLERISEGEDDFGSSSGIDPVIFEKSELFTMIIIDHLTMWSMKLRSLPRSLMLEMLEKISQQ